MKRKITILAAVLMILTIALPMSAEFGNEAEIQTAFSYYTTFDRTIEGPNYMEACVDAYCSGGQTGLGHALASVEYNQVMLDSDYDIGTFVTVWAHEGDYQDPSHILYPDEELRRALWSVNEQRWSDMDMTGNPVE